MARLGVTLAATLVAAVGSLALGTPQAAASSQGCTYTKFPSHYVCFSINGSGTYVSLRRHPREARLGQLDLQPQGEGRRSPPRLGHLEPNNVRASGVPDLPRRPDDRGVSEIPQPVVRLRLVLRKPRAPGHRV